MLGNPVVPLSIRLARWNTRSADFLQHRGTASCLRVKILGSLRDYWQRFLFFFLTFSFLKVLHPGAANLNGLETSHLHSTPVTWANTVASTLLASLPLGTSQRFTLLWSLSSSANMGRRRGRQLIHLCLLRLEGSVGLFPSSPCKILRKAL